MQNSYCSFSVHPVLSVCSKEEALSACLPPKHEKRRGLLRLILVPSVCCKYTAKKQGKVLLLFKPPCIHPFTDTHKRKIKYDSCVRCWKTEVFSSPITQTPVPPKESHGKLWMQV
eukprot:scaffold42243_cov168-Amphora_coffeaeformis.AAC.2